MAPFDGRYITSYVMAMVMFALSLTMYDILAKQIKGKKFDHENEGQGPGTKHVICTIRLEMFDSIYRSKFTFLR